MHFGSRFLEDSVRGWLASRQKRHGGEAWRKKAAHLRAGRKQAPGAGGRQERAEGEVGGAKLCGVLTAAPMVSASISSANMD